MHSRWILRSLALLAVLTLALPVAALAQTSRVEGMALQGDYIKDYTGIYTYTSEVPNVGNLIYGELGTLSDPNNPAIDNSNPLTLDRSMGAVLGNLWDGRFGTWAIHLREESAALGQGDASGQPNPGLGGIDPNHNANEAIDLMWGKKSGTTSFGLRFNRSFFKAQDEAPGITTTLEFDPSATPNLARNVIGIGGGVGFEMNPNTNVEVSAEFQNRSFEATAGGATEEEDKPTTWMVSGRAMWQWQPNVMVMPVIKWYSFDLSSKTNAPSSFDNTLSGWQIGAAGNWTLGTNDLFILGLTFAQNRIEQEEDLFGIAAAINGSGIGATLSDNLKVTETIAPQVFAALETHVNNWLTLRWGASKGAYTKIEAEDRGTPTETVKANLSPFKMNIGAGAKVGTLQLDAVVNTLFPQTLGGFFGNVSGPTGITGTSGFVAFPKVTATYPF